MRSVIATVTAVSLVGLAGCERYALDRQMEELCKKDGGIKVYETVTLPASEFSNVGQPLARYWKEGMPKDERFGPDYRYVETRDVLVGLHADPTKGEGQLVRSHQAIHRRMDGQLLGESVRYDRGGGDYFTFGFQPSGKSCPHFTKGLEQAIFIKGN